MTHDGTVTWESDHHIETVNGRGLGHHDQCLSILEQPASDGIALLSVGATTAQRTWSTYEQNAHDVANSNKNCCRTPS
jgi:hypothetical protein